MNGLKIGSHSVTLRANKAGTATITLTATSVADSTTADDITGSRSVTITVNDPAPVNPPTNSNQGQNNKSGDATLKSLTVAGKTYTNPSTDITVTVDSKTTTTNVSAVASNGAATVSGTGSKELATGSNTVRITVTAENGTKKTYNIRIRKLADETTVPNVGDNNINQNANTNNETNEENPDEQAQEPQKLRLSYLIVEDLELSPVFESEIFEYTATVTNRDYIDIVAQANMEGANVEITGDKELVEGTNEVIIKLTKDDETVEYRIVVNKIVEEVVVPENIDNTTNDDSGLSAGTMIIIGVVGVAITGGLAGLCIWKLKKDGDSARRAIRGSGRSTSYDTFND